MPNECYVPYRRKNRQDLIVKVLTSDLRKIAKQELVYMEIKTRKTAFDSLKKYDFLAKDDDFIEITEWSNGEGFDISINDKQVFSITSGQLDAINFLVQSLSFNKD